MTAVPCIWFQESTERCPCPFQYEESSRLDFRGLAIQVDLSGSSKHDGLRRRGWRPACRFNGDGKCFGLDSHGKRGIDYRCRAMRIRLEQAGWYGRTSRRNQPQFIDFVGRQRREIVGKEN